MEAGVVRCVLEAGADRFERVGVALLAVGLHGLVVERPRFTPVDGLVRLAGCAADRKAGSVPGRFPPRLRRDEDVRPRGRVRRLPVDLEGRVPGETYVHLLTHRARLLA